MKYEIRGGSFPVVVCSLEVGEQVVTERGSMAWMDPCIEMSTHGGGLDKMLGRFLSQESVFQNLYTAKEPGEIAFASSFPGKILVMEVEPTRDIVLQKSAFLASEATIELSAYVNQSVSGGLFGGEGFVMQRLHGRGVAFVECDGDYVERALGPGEQLVVDTGCVLGFDGNVVMEAKVVRGVKNIVLGGEGLFNTVLTGPGTVWLQTMPATRMREELTGKPNTASSKRSLADFV